MHHSYEQMCTCVCYKLCNMYNKTMAVELCISKISVRKECVRPANTIYYCGIL